MIDKPKRKDKLTNQDMQISSTIQDLINRYDLDNNEVYDYLDALVSQINKEIVQKEFITVNLGADYELTATESFEELPMTTIETKAGSKLTLYNGKVAIGKGIHHVRISGNVYFYTGTLDTFKNAAIYRNGTRKSTTNIKADSRYLHINVASKIIEVQEGDTIKLAIQGKVEDLIKAYNDGTFLTVEVID